MGLDKQKSKEGRTDLKMETPKKDPSKRHYLFLVDKRGATKDGHVGKIKVREEEPKVAELMYWLHRFVEKRNQDIGAMDEAEEDGEVLGDDDVLGPKWSEEDYEPEVHIVYGKKWVTEPGEPMPVWKKGLGQPTGPCVAMAVYSTIEHVRGDGWCMPTTLTKERLKGYGIDVQDAIDAFRNAIESHTNYIAFARAESYMRRLYDQWDKSKMMKRVYLIDEKIRAAAMQLNQRCRAMKSALGVAED